MFFQALVYCFACKEMNICVKFKDWVTKGLFWNSIIDFFIQAYIEVIFAIAISLSDI